MQKEPERSTLQTEDQTFLKMVGYLRSLVVDWIKRIPNRSLLRLLDRLLHEVLVRLLLNKYTGASAAALALVEEETEMTLLHSVLH